MRHLTFIALTLTLGCTSASKQEIQSPDSAIDKSNTATEKAKKVEFKSEHNFQGFDITVMEFYTWYLYKYYNGEDTLFEPMARLNASGVYQLDTSRYNQILRKSGFFSEEYFKHQDIFYKECNDQLIKVDTSEVNDCGCNPAEFTDKCGMTFYYAWLFHQGETTNDIRILTSELSENIASVKACLFDKSANSVFCESTVEVRLKQVKGSWKILEIKNAR